VKAEPAKAERSGIARAAVLRLVALGVIIVVAGLLAYKFGWLDYGYVLDRITALRQSRDVVSFAVVFVLIYGVATSIGVPATPLTVAAGALFGTFTGTLLSWTGGLLGAAVGYWIARTIGRDAVSGWVKRFGRVDAAMSAMRDFGGMLRVRLFPILPLGVISFVAGLASAPFLSYLAATAVGLIPSTLILTYFADSMVAGAGRNAAFGGVIGASLILILFTLAPRLLRPRP
jgi:uncharacterized membrane protein YdjX (TVP38/TMEM64 family)